MRINVRYEFHHPAETVYATFRDRLQEYVRYVPNITRIVMLDRTETAPGRTSMRIQWHGMGKIPSVIRSILKPEMISWEDLEDWDDSTLECRWVIRPYYFKEFTNCEGVWKFTPVSDSKCVATCTGMFHVRIDHFPPFPDFLVKKASPAIEGMIGGYIQPNLSSVFKAVDSFITKSDSK